MSTSPGTPGYLYKAGYTLSVKNGIGRKRYVGDTSAPLYLPKGVPRQKSVFKWDNSKKKYVDTRKG